MRSRVLERGASMSEDSAEANLCDAAAMIENMGGEE